jgi:hypothetical protein
MKSSAVVLRILILIGILAGFFAAGAVTRFTLPGEEPASRSFEHVLLLTPCIAFPLVHLLPSP